MSQPLLSHPCTSASVPLETAVTAAPDSKALGSSAPALPTLNPSLANTSPKCHRTGTHDVATAGPPPRDTSTSRCIHSRCIPQKAGACARQRGEDQPRDPTNRPKLDCSHYSATQNLVLLNAIF